MNGINRAIILDVNTTVKAAINGDWRDARF
jgi:hypothetical protein